MQKAQYVRLYSDEAGDSHFDDVEVTLDPVDFAPPAPPLNIAWLFPASGCGFVGGPPEWGGEVPHPAPRRQVFCTLSGSYEVTASDGERRQFPPGSMLLLEDTTGAGHSTRISEEALVFAVTLA